MNEDNQDKRKSNENLQKQPPSNPNLDHACKLNPKFCVSCGDGLQKASRFCGNCGASTAESSNLTRRNQEVDSTANRIMIAQLRDDASDAQLYFPEIIRVRVRLNPVNIQIHHFLGLINQITQNSKKQEIASIIQEALQSVDLTKAESILEEALDPITKIIPEIINACGAILLRAWPESKQFVKHSWLDNPAQEGENIQQELRRALQVHLQDLTLIQTHFQQLQDYHLRYHAIMTRTGIWDVMLGFAAGFFGGGLGSIGAQAWENWRGKSDAEFIQSFGNAVDQFSNAALAFTQKTEQEVEAVLKGFLKKLYDLNLSVISALEASIETEDISRIYQKLHFSDSASKPDEDDKQFLEIVISNLRDQKISARSESNIREVLGLV